MQARASPVVRGRTSEDMRGDSQLSIAEQLAHASNTKMAKQTRTGQSTKWDARDCGCNRTGCEQEADQQFLRNKFSSARVCAIPDFAATREAGLSSAPRRSRQARPRPEPSRGGGPRRHADHDESDRNCAGNAGSGNQRATMTPVKVMTLSQRAQILRADGAIRVEKSIAHVHSPGAACQQQRNPSFQASPTAQAKASAHTTATVGASRLARCHSCSTRDALDFMAGMQLNDLSRNFGGLAREEPLLRL